MQKRILPFSFKAVDDGEGIFTGDANVIGNVDLAGERVMPGAFKADLARRGSRRPLQWQHQTDEPIGVVDLVETERSLRVSRGQLALGVQRAREAFELLKVPGALGGMSIGYLVNKDRIAKDGVRELLEIEVLEVSLVTHPANPESRVDSVKAENAADLVRSIKSLARTTQEMRLAVEYPDPVARAAARCQSTLRELAAKLAA